MTTPLTDRLARSRLAPFRHEVLAHTRPGIRLEPLAPDPAPRLGASRFGGQPDVGPGFRWPRHQRPLSFLLQLDLAGIAPLPGAEVLPAAGLLSFFYDATGQPWGDRRADIGAWRVYFFAPGRPLRRVSDRPRGMSPEMVLPERGVRARSVDTLPARLPIWSDALAASHWNPDDEYQDQVLGDDLEPCHQLLGHPRPVQDDLLGAIDEHPGVVSLLQLDSDDRLGTSWGDMGKLHWLADTSDLLAARFDGVRLRLRCC